LEKATSKKEKILDEARKEADSILKSSKKEYELFLEKIEKQENKINEREEKIEEKFEKISQKQEEILKQEEELNKQKHKLLEKEEELENKISQIAKLSEKEAREIFLNDISLKYENDALSIIEKHKKSIEKRKVEESREIILKSIQQYAADVTSEVTTTLIPIPNEDIKGKLIGKE